MYHIRDNDVEAVEYRHDENHGKRGYTNTHNRDPCHNVDEIMTFLSQKIPLCYKCRKIQFY